MTGVEILTTETIYHTILPWWCALIGILGCVFCVGLLFAAVDCGAYGFGGVMALGAIGFLVLVIMTASENKDRIDYVKYKVVVSDEVSVVDFCDKYEIIEKDGKIFTVREKNK